MITVLLIEDSESDARLTQEVMKAGTREEFSCVRVKSLVEAIEVFKSNQMIFDIVLLDLGLQESQGIATLGKWFTEVGTKVPVVVLSGLNDRLVMIESVHFGAQDYLTKDEIIPGVLCRSLRYAIERHKSSQEHLKKSEMELEQARYKLIEVADSLHKLFGDKT